MIILPSEKSLDWKYPPVMLLCLVVINCVIFFFYQSNDEYKYETAFLHYSNKGILNKEWPAYQSYLYENSFFEELKLYESSYLNEQKDAVIIAIILDSAFYHYLEVNSDKLVFDPYDVNDNWNNWYKDRKRVNELIESTSALSFGLIPQNITIPTLLTHQFLHGNLMHLLGNMFFLVMCGFAVEAALGAWVFLVLYLSSGIIGGLLFYFTNTGSAIPLVGASGAISGVMALYLGIFRFRVIEFFYWVFFFAGYFRAPAMLILPIYISKELIDFYFNTDSNVAFMAHAGGFIGGTVLLAGLVVLRPSTINKTYIEEKQDSNPQQDARAKIYSLIDKIRYQQAIEAINKYQKDFGADFELLILRYHLAYGTKSPLLEVSISDLIKSKPINDAELDQLAKASNESIELIEKLAPDLVLRLALTLTTEKHISLAEVLFDKLAHSNQDNLSLGTLARKLSLIYEQLNIKEKQKYFSNFAEQALIGQN